MNDEELKELFRELFIKSSEINYNQHQIKADLREIIKKIMDKLNIDLGQKG